MVMTNLRYYIWSLRVPFSNKTCCATCKSKWRVTGRERKKATHQLVDPMSFSTPSLSFLSCVTFIPKTPPLQTYTQSPYVHRFFFKYPPASPPSRSGWSNTQTKTNLAPDSGNLHPSIDPRESVTFFKSLNRHTQHLKESLFNVARNHKNTHKNIKNGIKESFRNL